MSNIINKQGLYNPIDDYTIGGNLNITGLINSLIVSPNLASSKVASQLVGIDNSVGGSVSLS